MATRLSVSNRPENVRLVREFIRQWAKERGWSKPRRDSLEQGVAHLFQTLVTRAYRPDQPGSISIALEEKGPRVRLMFEDDAPPYNPTQVVPLTEEPSLDRPPHSANLTGIRQLADSLIYYHTADRKNRLVVFITL